MKILKHKFIYIGIFFIGGLLIASCINGIFFDGEIRQVQAIYDEDAHPVDVAPFEPSLRFLLGTDTNGRDLLHLIVEGAKYTIGLGILIATFRIVLSTLLGIIYSFYLMRFQKFLSAFGNAFQFIPVVLLAYFLLRPVLNQAFAGFEYSFATRVWFEIILLTLIALPTVSLVIGNEISLILKKEFIQSTKVLGGSKFFILKKHVSIHLYQRLLLIFTQQIIQVLLVIAHLGLFELYFGGTKIDYSILRAAPITTTFEWSGLIGDYFDLFIVSPWIPIAPIGAFALTILAFNLILKGLEINMSITDTPILSIQNSQELKNKNQLREPTFTKIKRDNNNLRV